MVGLFQTREGCLSHQRVAGLSPASAFKPWRPPNKIPKGII